MSVPATAIDAAPAVTADRADSEYQWYRWSAGHPVGALLIVGVVATQMATTIGYFLPAIGLPSLPWPLYNGVLWAPSSKYGSAGSFFVGEIPHFLNGMVFVFLFAVLMYDKLPFGRARAANLYKALLYGVILTIISAGVLVPLVYEPHQGFGWFSFSGPNGWKLPLAILVWHLVFVVHIAALHNPARTRQIRQEAAR
jgi:hypothetical protein